MKTTLIGIAAMTPNRVIGKGLTIPWHYSEDFKHFKKTTLGYPIVMGRKTFESLGKPLPKRHNIVISSTMEPMNDPNVTIVKDVNDFLGFIKINESFINPLAYKGDDVDKHFKIFVIGGSMVYKALIPYLSGMYMTHIKKEYDGDIFMPEFEHILNGKKYKLQDNEDFEIVYYERD